MVFSSSPKSTRSFVLLACTMGLLCGCFGSDSGLTVVSGVVKVNGEPATEGEIMFYPTSGRPAMSQIRPDGTYELTSFKKGDGVTPGKHKVTISVNETIRPNNAAAPNDINEENAANMAEGKIVWLIPQKYSERNTTTLTAEVEAGKPNEINFDSADFE